MMSGVAVSESGSRAGPRMEDAQQASRCELGELDGDRGPMGLLIFPAEQDSWSLEWACSRAVVVPMVVPRFVYLVRLVVDG